MLCFIKTLSLFIENMENQTKMKNTVNKKSNVLYFTQFIYLPRTQPRQ